MTDFAHKFYAERLREARIAAGLSMSTLATKADLSPQTVSAYENGTRKPTAEALFALAAALKITISYFKRDRPLSIESHNTVFFRSAASAHTRRNHDMRKQHANWAFEISEWFGQYVELPQYDAPEMSSVELSTSENGELFYSEEALDEAATKVRRAWGMGDGPISDMVRLLESKGIRVVRQRSGSQRFDAFSRIVRGQPMIFLSSDKGSGPRSRFDAAHELGHIILHGHVAQEALNSTSQRARIESEANYFAGSFLLPETTFAQELHGVTLNSFLSMKHRWKVSAQALIRRSYNIGAITDETFHRLCVQVSARGMRVKEPYDDQIAPEQPQLLHKAWVLLVENNVTHRSAIVENLALPAEFISDVVGIGISEFGSAVIANNILSLKARD